MYNKFLFAFPLAYWYNSCSIPVAESHNWWGWWIWPHADSYQRRWWLSNPGETFVMCEFSSVVLNINPSNQEKILASCAEEFVVIADYRYMNFQIIPFKGKVWLQFTNRKASTHLGEQWSKGIPIEVIPSAYRVVYQKIEKMLGGKSDLRMSGSSKAVGFLCEQHKSP